MLILAATPIGNLSDASERLKQSLVSATAIAAEDTRTLGQLAKGLGLNITAKLFSFHEHNERDRIPELVAIATTGDLLVVSDAGMPTISDPGFNLVRACSEAGVEVIVIPGPSAVLSALAVSGLATDRFCFEGFVPKKPGDKKKFFENLKTEPRTAVMFESPHRIAATLHLAAEVLGPRQASVSRELTKKFEQTVRGTLKELAIWADDSPKGEMVICIAAGEPETVDLDQLVALVIKLKTDGMGLKQAVTEVAGEYKVSKKELYELVIESKK